MPPTSLLAVASVPSSCAAEIALFSYHSHHIKWLCLNPAKHDTIAVHDLKWNIKLDMIAKGLGFNTLNPLYEYCEMRN